MPVPLKLLYPWKRRSSSQYPWQRHLDQDFLKYEQKRVSDASQWYNKFLKAEQKQPLEEIVYYVLPVQLNSALKVAITEKGNFACYMLSALRNTSQIPILMLIDMAVKQPTEYSLIRITKSSKDFLVLKDNVAEYVIIVESYETLDPQYIYVDVPFEKRVLQTFIKENMVNYEDLASSFQSVLSSSPYVVNDKGGISLASFRHITPFSQELILTMQAMQPPEFSPLPLSRKLIEGTSVSHRDGIKFRLAERYAHGSNFFRGFSADRYHYLSEELARRAKFLGEYSIFCSITPLGEGTEFLNDILNKFVQTEITHPFDFDEAKEYGDVDLLKTQRMIDEDLWLQVVYQRQLTPIIDENFFRDYSTIKKMELEWQIILDRMHLRKGFEHQAKVLVAPSLVNIKRICQSIARDLGKTEVTENIFNKGWTLYMAKADKLADIESVQRHAQLLPQHYETKKFNAIRAELGIIALTLNELYSRVSYIFGDKIELQTFLDKLQRDGNIYCPMLGTYKWI